MRNRIRLFVVLLYVVNLSSICLLAQTAGAKAHSVPKPVKARPQFAGIWNGAFGSNLGSQTIVFMMQQIGTTLTGTYQTGEGLQGE